MKSITTFVFCLLIGFGPQLANGQILKDIVRKASRSLENKAEDMIAEALAEAVARQLQKKIDSYFEDLARESYRQDSVRRVENGDTLVYRNYQEMLDGMLSSMNDASNIQEQYLFDLLLDVEVGSGQELDQARYFYSSSESIFAVEQPGDNGTNTMIMDIENDVIVMYMVDDKGKKTAQALPSFISLAGRVSSSSDTDIPKPMSITKTGTTKSVAGYTCNEYTGEDEEHTFKFYTSPDLAEYWKNGMENLMQRFTNYEYNEELKKIDGMVMESIVTQKVAEEEKPKKFKLKKKKEVPADTDTWKVTKVNKETLTFKKADYEFVGMGNN